MVRFKNRYVLIELVPEKYSVELNVLNVKQEAVYKTIVKTLQKLHGAYGYGRSREGLIVKYSNKELGILMIRIRRDVHKMILSILPYVKIIENKHLTLKCLYVGATINCCFKYLRKYQEQRLIEDLKKIRGQRNFKALYKKLLNRTYPKNENVW